MDMRLKELTDGARIIKLVITERQIQPIMKVITDGII